MKSIREVTHPASFLLLSDYLVSVSCYFWPRFEPVSPVEPSDVDATSPDVPRHLETVKTQ